MPVDFLTEEQQRRYGRYAGEPSPAQLGRYFHLDDPDRDLIARHRGDHNRLGFAAQLGTVRFLGTFLPDLTEVPPGVAAHLGRQLGIVAAIGLGRYAAGAKRWDHAAEIRRRYGYRDFHQGSEAAGLARWLTNRAWVSAERPSVLFDLATARLVERKVLLPGVTVLARLVAQVRDRAASRLWRTLVRSLKPQQAARLETLLVADETTRRSPLERLRRAPGQYRGPGRGARATPRDPATGGGIHRAVRRSARADSRPGALRRGGAGASHRQDVTAPPSRDPPRLRQGPGVCSRR